MIRPRGKSRVLTIRPDPTAPLNGLRATQIIVDDPLPSFVLSSQNPDVSTEQSGRRFATWAKPDPAADVPFLPYNGKGLADLTDMVKEMERRLTIWPKDVAADTRAGRHWEEPTVSVPASPNRTEGGAAEGSHEARSGE